LLLNLFRFLLVFIGELFNLFLHLGLLQGYQLLPLGQTLSILIQLHNLNLLLLQFQPCLLKFSSDLVLLRLLFGLKFALLVIQLVNRL
jgi:hypothetical protein